MQVKIVAGLLFDHRKIAHFNGNGALAHHITSRFCDSKKDTFPGLMLDILTLIMELCAYLMR